jgi:hypothetical protein
MDTTTIMQRTKQGELCWTDLGAKDLEGQTRFYEGLLGWTHSDMPTDIGPIYRQFMIDGMIVAGASMLSPDLVAQGMPSAWNTYFAADDAAALTKRAVELGGRVAMEPMDVMDQGRLAAVIDPTGAAFFFWQGLAHKGSQVFGKPGSLLWADLASPDPERAAKFYTELLGWKVDMLTGYEAPYWQASMYGVPEAGIMPTPPSAPGTSEVPPTWMVYFGVRSVVQTIERAPALGGNPIMGPMEVGNVKWAMLSDPAGAVFAIMEPLE